MDGWIALHRKIIESDLYFVERFTKMQAWIDLLLLANHKPATVFPKGSEIQLLRGELAYAQKTLSRRWQWNERTVKSFLEMLKKRGMIQYTNSRVTTTISILNYDRYQDTTARTTARKQHRVHTDNNVNNVNKDPGHLRKIEPGEPYWR